MVKTRFIYNLTMVFISLIALGSCNYESNISHLSELKHSKPAPQNFAGNYLAGRFAQNNQDWNNAQKYMNKVFSNDKENLALSEKTFLLSIGSGNYEQAKKLADNIAKSDGDLKELALIFLTSHNIKQQNYTTALNDIEKISNTGFGQITKPLLKTWILVGLGKIDEARSFLKENSFAPDPSYNIHAGLIEEFAGNDNEAEKYYKIAMANGLELHTALIVANFFERVGQKDIAFSIYENLDNLYPYKPFTRARKNVKDFNNNPTPKKGAAIALFDLTSILYNNRAYDSAKIYGNIVQMLENGSNDLTKIMMGDIGAVYNLYNESYDNYNSIDKNSPIYWIAQARIAELYELNGEVDKSIETLSNMAKDIRIRPEVMASLGDLYRRNNKFNEAIEAYNQALSHVKKLENHHWAILYARAIAKEQLEDWSAAEKDLLTALKIQPHNPHLLNHLAYSWAEQGINLDKALDYAQKASVLKPYDGAILDSYGWVLFKQGKFEQATNMLEEAILLLPNDAAILDHLGDAYWKNGRYNEARTQWRKAAHNHDDIEFQALMNNKIEYGIITADELKSQNAQLNNQ